MKLRFFLLGMMMASTGCFAQITLQECRQKAHDNYPVIKQYKLVEQSRDFNIDNAAKGYLPQISVTGLATYHTDMLKSSNITKTLDTKNSLYGGMVQISENIYDGGAISTRKSIAKADANVSSEQLNVTMYDINNRIDQL